MPRKVPALKVAEAKSGESKRPSERDKGIPADWRQYRLVSGSRDSPITPPGSQSGGEAGNPPIFESRKPYRNRNRKGRHDHPEQAR